MPSSNLKTATPPTEVFSVTFSVSCQQARHGTNTPVAAERQKDDTIGVRGASRPGKDPGRDLFYRGSAFPWGDLYACPRVCLHDRTSGTPGSPLPRKPHYKELAWSAAQKVMVRNGNDSNTRWPSGWVRRLALSAWCCIFRCITAPGRWVTAWSACARMPR